MPRYYAILGLAETPVEERADRLKAVESSGWTVEETIDEAQCAWLSKAFDDTQTAAESAAELIELMGERYVPQSDLVKNIDVARRLPDAPELVFQNLAATGELSNAANRVLGGLGDPDRATTVPYVPLHPKKRTDTTRLAPTDVAAAQARDATTDEGKASADTGPPTADGAQLAKQALQALAYPSKVWDRLAEDDEHAIARSVITRLATDRSHLARSIASVFALDIELLAYVPDHKRPELAEELIKVRSGLAQHQLDVQAERLELAKELRKQITKWTTIADAGIVVLIAGIIVSVLAIGGVLYMTASGTVSEWVLPAAIFTLALFAVSPAVLLLRERPLEGIDKWMPGGKASSDSGDTSDDGGSTSSSGSAGSSASSS